MDRRELLQLLGTAAAFAATGKLTENDLLAVGERIHRELTAQSQPKLFSVEQSRAITAASERIIPRTSTPGATDANVLGFIAVMMSDWYSTAELSRFVAGIDELNKAASGKHQRAFASCTVQQQKALLEEIDNSVVELRRTNTASANNHWFSLLKYLTVYGYCTSEPGMRQFLKSWPPPMHYDGAAKVS